jgi:hypothetical protein
LHDQHRSGDRRKVARSFLLRLSGRMQGIAERDDALQVLDALRAQVRRHATAHGLAADAQALGAAPGARGVGRFAKASLEHGRTVGNPTPFRHVREIKSDNVDAASGKPTGGRHHERMILAGARSVSEHQHGCGWGW